MISGYLKSSISTVEKRFGLSSQTSGLLVAFNEVLVLDQPQGWALKESGTPHCPPSSSLTTPTKALPLPVPADIIITAPSLNLLSQLLLHCVGQ